MFSNRKAKPALEAVAQGVPTPPPALSRISSMLAADMIFRGEVLAAGDLHLDGAIQGDVRADRLVIGESGNVEGAVTADQVEIRGRVAGPIRARIVRLCATAFVQGDITHDELTIDAGARFEGRCSQVQPSGVETAVITRLRPVG